MAELRDPELRDLGPFVAFPPTPALGERVVAALSAARSGPSAAPVRRAIVLALAATLVLAAVVAAAALVLPGLRIIFVPSVPTASPSPLAGDLALGDPVAVADVGVGVPARLGLPDEAYASDDGVVSLVWAPEAALPPIGDRDVAALMQVIEGALDRALVEKLVVEVGATVEPVSVAGAAGYWIEGPPHLVRYLGADGAVHAERTRLVGEALVWERDGVLYRLETAAGRDAAIEIAESVPAAGTEGP